MEYYLLLKYLNIFPGTSNAHGTFTDFFLFLNWDRSYTNMDISYTSNNCVQIILQ